MRGRDRRGPTMRGHIDAMDGRGLEDGVGGD